LVVEIDTAAVTVATRRPARQMCSVSAFIEKW
jgi:hypothetical protein